MMKKTKPFIWIAILMGTVAFAIYYPDQRTALVVGILAETVAGIMTNSPTKS